MFYIQQGSDAHRSIFTASKLEAAISDSYLNQELVKGVSI
jgi:hypothetical protein